MWFEENLDDLFDSEDMAAAASFPNVFCKLSGLVTEVPFNCPQWWILILHFSHPHQVDPPPPHHPSTPSLTHIDTPNTQCCTRLTRRGKKKFGVQKLSDLTQTSAFHSSAQTGSRWCRKKYGFRLELKGHMMLMNVKKKVWYNVNSDACSAPTGLFVKWQGQNTARSPKKFTFKLVNLRNSLSNIPMITHLQMQLQVVDLLMELVSDLSKEEKEKIFYSNAIKFYNLKI